MSLHLFAAFVTHHGTAANNRGETEGNTTTLQKLLWKGRTHTTVSAEAIRFALRSLLAADEDTNRGYDEDTRANTWRDPAFEGWAKKGGKTYIDDDLLGFMSAEAAKEENTKGKATVRRAVLEVTRAVSLDPWVGDVTFNAASPGATPSASKKGGGNPVPYATEMHATRYQYGIALTPERLRMPERAAVALRKLTSLGEVAGNQGRFLYDFSPESVVFRITQDPAPRILHCFDLIDGAVGFPEILRKVRAGDIKADELVVGGRIVSDLGEEGRSILSGARLHEGVVAAAEAAIARLEG